MSLAVPMAAPFVPDLPLDLEFYGLWKEPNTSEFALARVPGHSLTSDERGSEKPISSPTSYCLTRMAFSLV